MTEIRPRQSTPIPGACEQRGCDRPVAWVLHWEERGAPGPAFACHEHGRRSETRRSPIDLGADFPMTAEQRECRHRIEKCLENALHGIWHDPVGGNIRYNVESALRIMDEVDQPA